jgi:predicted nucleotidyltransferase
MKAVKTILQNLSSVLPDCQGVDGAILYGSYARQDATPQSDVDVAFLVNDSFSQNETLGLLNRDLDGVELIYEVQLRDKLVVYLNGLLTKMEISLHRNLESFSRNFSGSAIPDELVSNAILFDRIGDLKNRLASINGTGYKPLTIEQLVQKFIYEFDNSSTYQRRSDGYRSLYFYNIALHCLVQLKNMLVAENQNQFLPRNLLVNISNESERERFYELNGSMFLPHANRKKRLLLDHFYEVLESLDYEGLEHAKFLLERIYERDRYWNLRAVNTYNPKIRWKNLIRTSSPTTMTEELRNHMLNTNEIHTVIDLRADREIEANPYSEWHGKKLKIVSAPFDPWNQPDWFKQPEYQHGSNHEIAYRFFGIGCRDSIREALVALSEVPKGRGAVIHCVAGKDRTGIICSLLHLLTTVDHEVINTDYLASEADVHLWKLKIILDIIESEGGVEQYLLNCGLTQDDLTKLKTRLGHE